MRKLFSNIFILIMASLLSSCSKAVLISKVDHRSSGLSYYLPKTLLKITMHGVGFSKGTIVTELSDTAQQTAKNKGNVRVWAKLGGVGRYVLVNQKGQLLNDEIIAIKISDITPRQVADVKYNYVLHYKPDSFSSDAVCMGVDTKSLLQFVESSSKDQAGNIVIALSKLFGRKTSPEAFTVNRSLKNLDKKTFSVLVDPFNKRDLRSLEQALQAHFPHLARRGRFKIAIEGLEKYLNQQDRQFCPADKICYRAKVPVRIALVDLKSKRNTVFYKDYVEVVDTSRVHTIDVTRALFVEKVTRLGFNEGVLENVNIKKPSEGIALAKLPLTVYNAILTSALSAPGQFFENIMPGEDPAAILNAAAATAKNTVDLQKAIIDLDRAAFDELDEAGQKERREEDEKAHFTVKCSQDRPKSSG